MSSEILMLAEYLTLVFRRSVEVAGGEVDKSDGMSEVKRQTITANAKGDARG